MSIRPAQAANSLDYHPSTSRPTDRPSQPATANDVQVNPASSEVISSLLASLSSISLPSDSPSPLIPQNSPRSPHAPPPAQSARASARPSISHQRPPSRQQSIRDARDPSIDFTEVRHPPVPEDFPAPPLPQSDAAEPPTIRTARPPSGLSRLTAPRFSRTSKTSQSSSNSIYNTLSNFPSPPLSARSSKAKLDGPLPPLPKISAERLKSRAGFSTSRKSSVVDENTKPRGLGLQRDSLLLLRSREAKGKDKERGDKADDTATLAKASATSLPPPISRFRTFSPRAAQTSAASRVTSPARSFLAAPDDDAEDVAPGPSVAFRRQPSAENFVVVKESASGPRASGQDSRSIVPSRSSSLRNRSPSPPKHRLLSRRSSRQSHHRSPQTVPEETVAQESFVHDEFKDAHEAMPPSPLSPLTPMSPMSLDEDNEVVRRIRQLRAAKEERERMQPAPKLSSAPTSPKKPIYPPMNGIAKPPDTTRAVKQLEEAQLVEERKVKVQDSFPARNASLTPTSAAFAFQSLPPGTDNRPSTAVPGSPRSPLTPALSRSSSRSKRLSNPDLTLSKTVSHRRQSSRGQTAVPLYPAVVPEERRASFDSVKESVAEFLRSPRLSQKIKSPVDNRTISFSEVGDPRGYAVFCCIGMGVTRFVTAFYEELANSLKLRLITPERPGIGDSAAYAEQRAPLYWPDDVRAICSHLSIRDFSLIAHSTGTIYALATTLQMPSRVKGKIQILAPWIPPSQMTNSGRSHAANARAAGLPRAQRFLRYVPTSFLKLTNTSYFAGARPPTKSPLKGRKSGDSAVTSPRPSTSSRAWNSSATFVPLSAAASGRPSTDRYPSSFRPPMTPNLEEDVQVPFDHSFAAEVLSAGRRPSTAAGSRRPPTANEVVVRQKQYDEELTHRVWDLSTKGANPTVDLIVCFERNQPIGFRYADIQRKVMIRHGSKDQRVPLDNVKWLCKTMPRADLAVLEGEGHNLMSSAGVMAQVLSEIGKEWENGMDSSTNDSSSYKSPVIGDDETFDDP